MRVIRFVGLVHHRREAVGRSMRDLDRGLKRAYCWWCYSSGRVGLCRWLRVAEAVSLGRGFRGRLKVAFECGMWK